MGESGRRDAEAFVSNHPLTRVFGTGPKVLIVGAMLAEDEEPATAFSHNEIARIAGLDEETVREHVGDLQELGLVVDATAVGEETDEPGGETYALDPALDVSADLRQLNDDLADLVF